MTLTLTETTGSRSSLTITRSFRRDGLVGLWGRLRHREADAYETWLEQRDMIIITATMMRLSERQLNRIGMSRQTLAMDIDDLAERTLRERQISREVIEIVDDSDQPRAYAAE